MQGILPECLGRIDYKQWAIRCMIIFICAILGAVLAREHYRKYKKISKFALFQILISFYAPISVGHYIEFLRETSGECDWEIMLYGLDQIRHGAWGMWGELFLYVILAISTIITIIKIYKLKNKKSSKSSK